MKLGWFCKHCQKQGHVVMPEGVYLMAQIEQAILSDHAAHSTIGGTAWMLLNAQYVRGAQLSALEAVLMMPATLGEPFVILHVQ